MPDSLDAVQNHLAYLYGQGGAISGLPTGFSYLDHLTSGLQLSDVVILGGRPGMGKTAMALNLTLNMVLPERWPKTKCVMKPFSVCFFSLEMSRDQLIQRLISQLGGYNLKEIRSGGLKSEDMARLPDTVNRLRDAKIHIDDSSLLTPNEVRARTRALKRRLEGTEFPLKMIVIDYLQIMRPDGRHQNNELAVREISGRLKALAKELNIVVLALSQLRRPKDLGNLSLLDLRDSGSIEQDADLILFVVREDLVHPDKPELKNKSTLTIHKHRNGPTGKVWLNFIAESSSFENDTLTDQRQAKT
jgi:replicative DNA helicase